MYGDIAIGESTARKWFSRFKEDRFDIRDIPHSGKPFVTCMGTLLSGRARQENGFVVLRRIVLTLATLHVKENIQGLMKIV